MGPVLFLVGPHVSVKVSTLAEPDEISLSNGVLHLIRSINVKFQLSDDRLFKLEI